MCFSSGSSSGANNVAQEQLNYQQQQDAQRQQNITSGESKLNDIFSQYTPDYYNNLANQYSAYYQPQVADQYQLAQQSLLYGQANQGIINSSAGAYENSQLDKQNSQQEQQVASGAQGYANDAQQQVQTLRNNLTNQLVATGDDSAISPADTNSLNIQSASSMTPLTGLFNNLTSLYGNYSQAAAITGQNNILNSALLGGSSGGSGGGSSKVIK